MIKHSKINWEMLEFPIFVDKCWVLTILLAIFSWLILGVQKWIPKLFLNYTWQVLILKFILIQAWSNLFIKKWLIVNWHIISCEVVNRFGGCLGVLIFLFFHEWDGPSFALAYKWIKPIKPRHVSFENISGYILGYIVLLKFYKIL